MYKFDNEKDSINPPLLSLGYFFLFIIGGMGIGSLLSALFLQVSTGVNLEQLSGMFENIQDYPELKTPYLIAQGIVATILFIGAPYLCLRLVEKKNLTDFNRVNSTLTTATIILGILAIIFIAPLNSKLLEWNRMLPVPFWMIQQQAETDALTSYLTTFDSTSQYLLSFITIALIAAVGEEFVFRGLLQNIIFKVTKNTHFAIWITAVIFSAIHLQFQDFFVRMILGALLGYIYYWSGNILVPMIVHFFNNAITIIFMDMANTGVITNDIESTETIGWGGLFISTILFVVCIYYFRKISFKTQVVNE